MEAHALPRVRHSSSQYDFVKVRVWLGEGDDRHATVLSRFLLVRTLTAAKARACELALSPGARPDAPPASRRCRTTPPSRWHCT